jgi:hypothetical protein
MVIYKLINKTGEFNMKKYIFCCLALGMFFSEGYAAGDSGRRHGKLPHPPMVQTLSGEQQELLNDALETADVPGQGTGGSLAEDYGFHEVPDPAKQREILKMISWEGLLAQKIERAEKTAKRESHMGGIGQGVRDLWRSCGIYAIPMNAEIDRVFKDKDDLYRERIKSGCNKLRELWDRTKNLPG